MTVTAGVAEPFRATDLDIRYEMIEDRLLLTARASGVRGTGFWLTRKLARSLLGGLVDIMVRSNEEARRTPSAQRHDVLLFEHLSALERRPVASGDQSPQKAADTVLDAPACASPRLLLKIDLSIVDGALLMRLGAADERAVEFRFPRDAGHQLIHVLMLKCRDARWEFSEFDWIDRRANIVMPSGLRPS